jgi:predicted nucleic acid-binding protein
MAATWTEVGPSARVREHAARLVRVHVLRTGDAFQLAAAQVWAAQSPGVQELVTLDGRLREAALKEGFVVLPEES